MYLHLGKSEIEKGRRTRESLSVGLFMHICVLVYEKESQIASMRNIIHLLLNPYFSLALYFTKIINIFTNTENAIY